ncbi:MAG: N-6 DNA methylase, partial [Anaerolineae bacterium]|nr:N-6 DNA methylase [Anaerolineae bacterium]
MTESPVNAEAVAREAARATIAGLVERFQKTAKAKRDAYSEQETRLYFILPMFKALGWDIENPAEMTAEEQISRGFVDFGFYLNGVPAFYLETKRVSADLAKPEHMKQAINYSYLRGVTWAVLSDFEETIVFNAEWEERDPEHARFVTLHWGDYAAAAFDDLWLLSRTAMLRRELDARAERYGKKRRREAVTDKLFKQLTDWRRSLFNVIQQFNTDKLWVQDPREVDNAVQRFIDRLIFIRTAEDRGIEPNRLQALVRTSKGKLWADLRTLFRELDGIYNSNLFAESTIDLVDVYDPDLIIEIIKGLYQPPGEFAQYDFNAISADVLGKVYEQYLGFKAQDPEGKQSLLGGKQQKRKSQGIYYTPQFVVRYIVQQTVGKLLQSGADPHSLRILDPACGSGSFLIEAFDVLDRWLANTEPEVDPAIRRRRILTENIYGVDLDDQAVEVTRLNLLLRASLERGKLPILHHIQRGNSLIDDPAVAGDAAFNWQKAFPEVMDSGGFDAVIGNPPYIRIQSLPLEQVEWMSANYESAAANYDIYIPFVERGLQLLNLRGRTAYILPHKFFNARYGSNLRHLITKGKHLSQIVHFGDLQIFEGATTYTCILVLAKNQQDSLTYSRVLDVDDWRTNKSAISFELAAFNSSENDWTFADQAAIGIYEKLRTHPTKLESVTNRIYQGIKTGSDKIFVLQEITVLEDKILVLNESDKSQHYIEKELLRTLVKGGDVSAFQIETVKRRIFFPYERQDDGTIKLISEASMLEKYPLGWKYITTFKAKLEERERGLLKGKEWHGYTRNQAISVIDLPKIITPDIAPKSSFALDPVGNALFMGGVAGGYGIVPKDDFSFQYLLGILNSTLLQWFLQKISTSMRGGWYSYEAKYIRHLPIRTINFDDPDDVAKHDRMVSL